MSDTEQPQEPQEPQEEAKGTDWKSEARKWEARAKANNDAAARLQELEDAQKTEAQKQAEALAEAQAKLKDYETQAQVTAWKTQVSKETGVPAEALAGSSLEELTAHAEVLKSLISTPESKDMKPFSNEGQTPSNHTLGGNAQIFADAISSILK